jgi:hypothetical protein
MPHVPAAHVATPLLGEAHVWPQPPQWFGFDCSFTQAPAQFCVPAGHRETHLDAAQTSF